MTFDPKYIDEALTASKVTPDYWHHKYGPDWRRVAADVEECDIADLDAVMDNHYYGCLERAGVLAGDVVRASVFLDIATDFALGILTMARTERCPKNKFRGGPRCDHTCEVRGSWPRERATCPVHGRFNPALPGGGIDQI